VIHFRRDKLMLNNYRPDIDGLRAIAVLSVLGFHAFPVWVQGGFVGVDVFFVISGFLISGIIFRELACGEFSYKDFYARRVRRIFPSLIVVLITTLLLGYRELFSIEFSRIAGLSRLQLGSLPTFCAGASQDTLIRILH
jgi:peptidoglycan/LPS O-acetylase OafA/YrhL